MKASLNQNLQSWQYSLYAFCERTGCIFVNFSLLEKAMTHVSWANEHEQSESNERLEFLGDAILEQAVSLALYKAFPDDDEGQLTKRRVALVCETSLAFLGRQLGLDQLLRLGPSLQGQVTDAMMADAVEAFVAALYLDGGSEALSPVLTPLLNLSAQNRDAKTALIELCQAQDLAWHFQNLQKEGPDHRPWFTVELCVAQQVFKGQGATRKGAEQHACSTALQTLAL